MANPSNPGTPAAGNHLSPAFDVDACMTCGLCASACPVAGVDGFDPRMLVRLMALGLGHAPFLLEQRGPCALR